MMRSITLSTIWLLVGLSDGLSYSSLARRGRSVPAPISIPPTSNWGGDAGQWNTIAMRIGSPPQISRVLVSTASQESFAINPKACQFTTNQFECFDVAEKRGGIFHSNRSTTFEYQGLYKIYMQSNLNYTVNAQVGYDEVGLGYVGEGMPTLKHQIIGTIAADDYQLGYFGLHPKSTNFTDYTHGVPSYMATLYQQKLIPSISWGYTAGAMYRFARVTASLTLGGYDQSRFISNNISFTLGADNERELLVHVNSITVADKSEVAKSLLPTPIFSFIDSTVSEIWLPEDACKLFEREFGLTYDEATKLYFVSDLQHTALVARNPNVTISLSTAPQAHGDVKITLPYAAFDLVAKPPYRKLTADQRYFPLRRAANDTQYTLGRTFLQEAYLTVDWERQNFSVSQCAWEASNQKLIVPILTINSTMGYGSSTRKNTASTGVIAGIAIGVVLLVSVIVAIFIFFCRSNKRRKQREEEEMKKEVDSVKAKEDQSATIVLPKHELDAGEESTMAIMEKDADLYKVPLVEAPENDIFELAGDIPEKPEADGRELSEKEAVKVREHRYNGIEEPLSNTSPISPLSPGTETTATNISAPSEGTVAGNSPISPLTGGTLVNGQQPQRAQPQVPKKRIDPAEVEIVCDEGASNASDRTARPTPGEQLEGSNGWSQLPDRETGDANNRKRFSFEK